MRAGGRARSASRPSPGRGSPTRSRAPTASASASPPASARSSSGAGGEVADLLAQDARARASGCRPRKARCAERAAAQRIGRRRRRRAAPRRRVLRCSHVVAQHPLRAEAGPDRAQRVADRARASLREGRPRRGRRTAGRPRRCSSAPQRGAVARVLRRGVSVDLAVERPAVGAVVGLGPPAVEHAQVEPAVDRRLHPARAARLERRPRQVQPDVAALRRGARRVRGRSPRERRRAPATSGVALELEQLLRACACRPRRAGWALPARTIWTGCGPREQLARARSRSCDEQPQALVGREPPREADRQRVGVEASRRPRARSRATRPARAARRRCARAPRRRGAHAARGAPPTARRGDLRDRLPRPAGRRCGRASPSPQVAVQQRAHRRADPGRLVHAVGDVADRHLARPSSSGHRSCHIARATSPWRRLTPLRAPSCESRTRSGRTAPPARRARARAGERLDVEPDLVGERARRRGRAARTG